MPGSEIEPDKKMKNTDTISGEKASKELQKALISCHGQGSAVAKEMWRRTTLVRFGEAMSHLSPK